MVVFQPHRYTRTRDLLAEFATAFNDADVLVVLGIYAASEEPIPGVSGEVAGPGDPEPRPPGRDLRRAAGRRRRAPLAPGSREGDLVVTLGAGDVTQVGPELLQLLEPAQQGGRAG